ncbi:MAG: chorismate synthase [Ruminococcaceae bacterium]|nr:chorismate synthase [Oscillospiraceae bacterium]
MPHPYGKNIRLDIRGGSHDPEISMTLSGLPAGIAVDIATLQAFLARRAPGQNAWSTPRREADQPHFTSGMTQGADGLLYTDGSPIEAVIYNTNTRSQDYDFDVPRPGHADLAARLKYGDAVDLRGGGHFSGRLTALMCVAGGICLHYLATKGIRIGAHALCIGGVCDTPYDPVGSTFDAYADPDFPVLDMASGAQMKQIIADARTEGDSVGGTIECKIVGVPAGLGEHMFRSVEGAISEAVWGIPAVKGIMFGAGFAVAEMRGSENNDSFRTDGTHIYTETNHAGGILGGMTYGMPILFTVAIKPTPSIAKEQDSISCSRMGNTKLQIKGRHDPCIVPRAVPVVEAAAALAMVDLLLDE